MAFFEIVFSAEDFLSSGFTGRDQLEDPLDEALQDANYGEVTGGGGGLGMANIDLETNHDIPIDIIISFLRETLLRLNAPKSTVIKIYDPEEAEWRIYPQQKNRR